MEVSFLLVLRKQSYNVLNESQYEPGVAQYTHKFRTQLSDTDIILRTHDNVSMYAHKLILAQASTFFQTMFELPQENMDGLPIVDVSEPSIIWEPILSIIYPIHDTLPQDIGIIKSLLEAAKKYEMDVVTDRMHDALLSPTLLNTHAFQIFTLACAYNLPDVQQIAARATLPHATLDPAGVRELDDIPASMLLQLLSYRRRCRDVAVDVVSLAGCTEVHVVKDLTWFAPQREMTFFHCRVCATSYSSVEYSPRGQVECIRARMYWKTYMDAVGEASKERPVGRVAKDPVIIAPVLNEASKCDICGPKAYLDLTEFAEILSGQVDRAVSRVRFTSSRHGGRLTVIRRSSSTARGICSRYLAELSKNLWSVCLMGLYTFVFDAAVSLQQ